jgi:deferrochelatase/peroxidase EfeB
MSKPQVGILNRPPDHVVLVALNLTTADPAGAHAAVERLRVLARRESRSNLDDTTPQSPKDQPSAETGELGFTDGYDRYHLTVTVGFAKTAYDKLGVSADERPADLIPIPWDLLSDAPEKADNGDLVLQLCTDSVYIAEHVVRRIEEELGDVLTVAWTTDGHQRQNSRAGRVSRDEGRALIGFLDGTSNLNPKHDAHERTLVFVDPDPAVLATYPPQVPTIIPGQPSPYGGTQPPQFPELRQPPTREPAWTKNGTYMVVRASVVDTAGWDRRSLHDQEQTVGRFKVSGNALDAADNPAQPIAEPNFAADPDGAITPLTAHVRRTNPRAPEDADRRIFRRGYPLVTATLGGMQRGLVFICFGRTITTQFEFITRAWTANPNFPSPNTGVDRLREVERVLCGGYFFVPPLRNGNQPWSWHVPAAA